MKHVEVVLKQIELSLDPSGIGLGRQGGCYIPLAKENFFPFPLKFRTQKLDFLLEYGLLARFAATKSRK